MMNGDDYFVCSHICCLVLMFLDYQAKWENVGYFLLLINNGVIKRIMKAGSYSL